MLLSVVMLSEVLAFILMLASSVPEQRWQDLGLISLFIQWIALSGVLALCLSRPLLRRLSNRLAGVVSYLILLVLTLLVSEMAFRYVGPSSNVEQQWDHVDFILRNMSVSAIVCAGLLRYFYLQYYSRQLLQAEHSSRLDALQARIRPHFLFNSMNVIACLTRIDPKLAEKAIENLAQVFRASLSTIKQSVPLSDELAICESYLYIEKLRLGDRLDCTWVVDDSARDVRLPALLLQPLIENAIIHGIEDMTAGGTINFSARCENDFLHVSIENPLHENKSKRKGNRIAQANIRARLANIYGDKAKLEVMQKHGCYRVEMHLPITKEG